MALGLFFAFLLPVESQAFDIVTFLKNIRNNIQYKRTWLPRGTVQKRNQPTDIVDKTLYDLTIKFGMEVGTLEFLDKNGRVIAINAHTSANESNIDSRVTANSLRHIIKLMTEGGWSDHVTHVRMRHTHPDSGNPFTSQFSRADKIATLYLKAYLDYHFGRSILFTSELVYPTELETYQKRIIVIPEKITLLRGHYTTDSAIDKIALQPNPEPWKGSNVAPYVELADVVENIYEDLSAKAWEKGWSVYSSRGIFYRELSLKRSQLLPNVLTSVKEATTAERFISALHSYISIASEPTSLKDITSINELVEEGLKKHFNSRIDLFKAIINYQPSGSSFLHESGHERVLKALVITLKHSSITNNTFLILNELQQHKASQKLASRTLADLRNTSQITETNIPSTRYTHSYGPLQCRQLFK